MSQFLDLTGLEILWDKIKTKFERLATADKMGYIKIGYSSSGKNYAVQLDTNGQAYVNVPWTDTNTTYTVATADKLGLVKIGYSSSGKNYAVQLDSNNKMYVNVPWTDSNTTYTFTPTNPTLSWGTSTSIGTIGGTTFKVGLPANPNTDTKVTSVENHYTPEENTEYGLSASADTAENITGSSKGISVITGLKRDAAGHIVGIASRKLYSTDTNTKVTSVGNHYTPTENTASAINAADGTATNITGTAGVLNVVTGLKRDAAGHVVGVVSKNIYSTDNNTTYSKITADELTAGSATESRVVQPSVLGPWVKSQIDSKIAVADAMIYKGTLGTGGTITALPASHSTGWTYKVITAGTYAGVKCEVGDMVICLTDGTTATDSHWTVVQNNIDGAVIGPASAGANAVAIFDGTTGKLIKSSGYTIASSVPSGAKFTDTDTKVTSVGNHYTPAADTNAALSVDASSTTSATWGSTDLVTGVNIARDAKGHVTGITVDSIQMPANPNTDTKVTSVGNHYTPATDTAAGLSANASSTTSATWGSTDLVTGVSLTRDAKGHVTGLSVSSIQMPANPNTDTDTHWTSKNVICASATGTANATATNGNVYLNHLEQSSVKSSHKITGSGATTVTTDASGNITISSTNTTYSFSASNPTLSWGTKTKIGTIGGVDFYVTMPANPDTGTTDSAIPIASIEALS